jgi:hypothetical protein
MEQRLSAVDERKLTNAIEKAATLASLDDSKDRNELLAAQLKEAGVDKCMAKVASCAFNKRITVLTFQKTADEHRAEPFALTDGDVVYKLLGGESQEKTASVQPVKFYIGSTVVEVPMQKTASVQTVKKPNYEDTVDIDKFQTHLENDLHKHAAEFSKLSGIYESLDSDIKERTQRLADYFQKSACSSFEFTTLNNYFGNEFKDAFKEYLPETTDFSKTASACILGSSAVYKDTAKLIEDRRNLQVIGDYIGNYSKGLSEFCKTAGALGDCIAVAKARGLLKTAAGYMAPGAAAAIRGLGSYGLLGVSLADKLRESTQNAMLAGFDNARNMYNAGNDVSESPGKVLDSDFLVNDRYRDRLLGWSDMSADPQFKMYPSDQVFSATQKAMDMDGSLERPDRREVLRAQVAQLLAQNNRASTADVAALATTLKALAASSPNAAQMAAAKVDAMDKVLGTAPVEFKHMSEAAPAAKDYDPTLALTEANSYVAATSKKNEEEEKERAKEQQRLREREEDISREEQRERARSGMKERELDQTDRKLTNDENRTANEARKNEIENNRVTLEDANRKAELKAQIAQAAQSSKDYRQAITAWLLAQRSGRGNPNSPLPQPPNPAPQPNPAPNPQPNPGNPKGNPQKWSDADVVSWKARYEHFKSQLYKKDPNAPNPDTDPWNAYLLQRYDQITNPTP